MFERVLFHHTFFCICTPREEKAELPMFNSVRNSFSLGNTGVLARKFAGLQLENLQANRKCVGKIARKYICKQLGNLYYYRQTSTNCIG